MPKHPLLILGSARKNGNTHLLVNNLFYEYPITKLDLLDYNIFPYYYAGSYPEDDQFMKVVDKIVEHDKLVFVTPVYWYAMSGLMKTFFDRLTDIVTIHKQIGRKLNEKEVFLIATGSDDKLPDGFEIPFSLTSAYLHMQYQGVYYCSTDNLTDLSAKDEFIAKLYRND